MRPHFLCNAALLLPLLLLPACTVGPNYHRPAAPVPAAFKEAPAGWKTSQPQDGQLRGAWWQIYNDPVLDTLASQVAINNQNLKAYEAAYREAVAVVQEAQASYSPTISASPSVTRARSNGTASTSQTVEASASWEPDLWGKVRRQVESDKASAQASAAELADLTLSAQSDLVTDYMELRYQDSLIDLLNRTIQAYQRSLSITQNQCAAGIAARSDVITAQTQLESTRASAVAATESRAQYEHAIALLIGKAPSDLTIAPGGLAQAIPAVPGVLPSELLERRPDIAEAERSVQQESALIGVQVAAFYPTITLSASGGFSGLSPLFSAANTAWSLAASGSATLFEGGYRSAAVSAARAAYDQSVANYRQTVLTAFKDVEDQLSNLRILEQQAVVQDSAVSLSRQAVTITLNEYRAGTVDYTTVITAQATALSNEESALEIRQNRLLATANLIGAVGGGWDASALPKIK